MFWYALAGRRCKFLEHDVGKIAMCHGWSFAIVIAICVAPGRGADAFFSRMMSGILPCAIVIAMCAAPRCDAHAKFFK
eukprot:12401143-Karenia_brevis.AAC.1